MSHTTNKSDILKTLRGKPDNRDAYVVVSPDIGSSCLEKIDDRHLRISAKLRTKGLHYVHYICDVDHFFCLQARPAGAMADLEAVLADVSYLMAMEKSKSTPAARASKRIVLPDPR